MPRVTFPVFSARSHKPLINFIGKRIFPSSPTPAHPHPAAPPEYRKAFPDAFQNPSDTTRSADISYQEFWDAPARFWRPKHHELEQPEIDVIQSGGASMF